MAYRLCATSIVQQHETVKGKEEKNGICVIREYIFD